MDNPYAVGIDFGTTSIKLSFFKSAGENQGFIGCMPNLVRFNDGEISFELLNEEILIQDSANTVKDIKKILGIQVSSPHYESFKCDSPLRLVSDDGDNPKVEILLDGDYKSFPVHYIVALILRHIKTGFEGLLGHPIKNVVITVPTSFGCRQRKAMIDCGLCAELNVTLLNGTSAIALCHCIEKPAENQESKGVILIVDFGYGWLDVAVLESSGEFLNVLASNGDSCLGMSKILNNVISHVLNHVQHTRKLNLQEVASTNAMVRLRLKCERAIVKLSEDLATHIYAENFVPGITIDMVLKASTFEELNADLFSKMTKFIIETIHAAKKDRDSITKVLISGGGSSIPRFRDLLNKLLPNIVPIYCRQEEESLGAAYKAAILYNEKNNPGAPLEGLIGKPHRLTDILTTTLLCKTSLGTLEPILTKGAPCPGSSLTLPNTRSLGDSFEFDVYEGDAIFQEDAQLVANYVVSLPITATDISLCLTVSMDGLLDIHGESTYPVERGVTIGYPNLRGCLSKHEIIEISNLVAPKRNEDLQIPTPAKSSMSSSSILCCNWKKGLEVTHGSVAERKDMVDLENDPPVDVDQSSRAEVDGNDDENEFEVLHSVPKLFSNNSEMQNEITESDSDDEDETGMVEKNNPGKTSGGNQDDRQGQGMGGNSTGKRPFESSGQKEQLNPAKKSSQAQHPRGNDESQQGSSGGDSSNPPSNIPPIISTSAFQPKLAFLLYLIERVQTDPTFGMNTKILDIVKLIQSERRSLRFSKETSDVLARRLLEFDNAQNSNNPGLRLQSSSDFPSQYSLGSILYVLKSILGQPRHSDRTIWPTQLGEMFGRTKAAIEAYQTKTKPEKDKWDRIYNTSNK